MTDATGKDIINYTVPVGVEYVRYFIEHGACIDARSGSSYRVPLQLALRENPPYSIEDLSLLISPNTINHKDLDLRTPLHDAVIAQYPIDEKLKIINLLVDAGANMHMMDVNRESPMKVAINMAENGYKDARQIVEYFNKLVSREGCYEENGSFAPPRENVNVKYYVDGDEYFPALAEAMFYARRCIYITDWWLTHDYQLIRHQKDIPNALKKTEGLGTFQLDRLLQQKAETGVDICIILWQNVESAMPLSSEQTENHLKSLNSNIRVVRHGSPKQDFCCWSHHQKTVIIDNKIAFLGGLDMCLHRYDYHHHPLTDESKSLFQGKDYFTVALSPLPSGDPFITKEDFKLVDRSKICRMPCNLSYHLPLLLPAVLLLSLPSIIHY